LPEFQFKSAIAVYRSEELRETLSRLLSANEVLSGEAVIEQLVDEHANSIFVRSGLTVFKITTGTAFSSFLLTNKITIHFKKLLSCPLFSSCAIYFARGGLKFCFNYSRLVFEIFGF
jgi:hypothetical protein